MAHPLMVIYLADALNGPTRFQERTAMPLRMLHHIDLAVSDVERSRAFYVAVLGPFGLREGRYPSYRGTEQVVYLRFGDG